MTSDYKAAIGSLFLTVLIMAFQDVYLAVRLDQIHPSQLIVLMFSSVTILAFGGLVLKRPRWPKFSLQNILDITLLNISTSASWLGTFWALKHLQPTVVSALTLSVPPAFSVATSFRTKQGRANRFFGTFLVGSGISIALFANSNLDLHLDNSTIIGLVASIVAALGVWANAVFTRRTAQAGFTTNQIFSMRFHLLIFLSALYLHHGSFYSSLTLNDLVVFSFVAVFTFYLPMLLLYRSSIQLSVHTITIGLALTPLITLIIQSFSEIKVTPQEILGMGILGMGVVVGILNQQRTSYE